MKLKEWMDNYKISYRNLAKDTGIDHTALHRYAHRERQPSLGHALTIERISKGKVSVSELSLEGYDRYNRKVSVQKEDSSDLSGVPS